MTIDIGKLTLNQIKELNNAVGGKSANAEASPWKVGENYLIRTVTMIQVGKLEAVYAHELVLSKASWIADTGRFHDALKKGALNEVEPFVSDVVVGRGAIVDATLWAHKLPTDQK